MKCSSYHMSVHMTIYQKVIIWMNQEKPPTKTPKCFLFVKNYWICFEFRNPSPIILFFCIKKHLDA